MRRPITQENLRAITDPYTPEVTEARWRGTRSRLLRVLLYAVLIIGGIQLCSLSRQWTAAHGEEGEPVKPGSQADARRDPLA